MIIIINIYISEYFVNENYLCIVKLQFEMVDRLLHSKM